MISVLRKLRAAGSRLVLVLLLLTGAVAAVSVVTAHPALAITTCVTPGPTSTKMSWEPRAEPTYNFTPHVTCTTLAAPASQLCQTKGFGSGETAVECTEIYVNTNHSANYVDIYAVGSYYCTSGSGSVVNCGYIDVRSAIAEAGSGSSITYGPEYVCQGNCPSSGAAMVSSYHIQLPGVPGGATDNCVEVWGVDPATETIAGATFTGDFSGTHVNICANDQIVSQ
jgi:hypothetical protein